MSADHQVVEGSYRPRRLKPWSWLFLCTLPILLALMAYWYWQFAFISLLICLPSIRLYFWWYKNQSFAGPLDHLVSSYAQGFYLIFAISNIAASIAFIATQAILSWCARVMLLNKNTRVNTLIEGASWSAWVLIEEVLKVSFAYAAKRMRAHVHSNPRETKAWVSAATATAFGYATSQSILFVCVFTALLANDDKISWIEFGWLLLYAFIFGAVAMPLSVLASYLAGLELTRETHPSIALAWPAGLRVIYVFQFFFWFAVLHPKNDLLPLFPIAASIAAVYYLALKRIRAVEKTLPFSFMQNVAPLRRDFGFALLPSADTSCDNDFSFCTTNTTNRTTEMISIHTNPLPVLAALDPADTEDPATTGRSDASISEDADSSPATPKDVVEL